MKSLAFDVRSVLLSAPEVGSPERLRGGSVLFEQAESIGTLFLIESGLVKLIRTSFDGRTFILSVMGPHQVAGVEGLAQAHSSQPAAMVCLSDVTGYRIPIESVNKLLSRAEFMWALMAYLIARDNERIHQIEMLTLCDVEQRTLYALADLAQMVKPAGDGTMYPIPITQVDLASLIGATRETTSATLSNLQMRQLVKLGRRLVTVLVHPEILIEAAGKRPSRSIKLASGASLTAAAP